MLFNSLTFAAFLPVVFALYWLIGKDRLKAQNVLLLAASYFFYSCWDWRFLFLLMFSTALDYFTGIRMHEAKNVQAKKFWFWLSIIINLGFLGVFKYYNFFAESMAEMLSNFGLQTDVWSLQVILPIGISFYTFHGLSYVIDIYKERIKPEYDIVAYSLFVSYFPLLVAGPIERATHLLPQIKKKRNFDFKLAKDGLQQILYGLFKKIVVADTCAVYANNIFSDYENANSLTLILGAVYFAFQIYGDFSGYSDIALGTSKLFGMHLLRNFNFPYFSRDIAEFWRRWHISLSSWFRDYLYIPLGGSKGGTWMKVRNTFIIFLVSGFWHGANWTFVAWGLINAIYFLPLLLTNRNRTHLHIVAEDRRLPTFRELISIITTFALAVFAWIFFRAESISMAFDYIRRIFSLDFGSGIQMLQIERYNIEILALVAGFVLIEWIARRHEHPFTGRYQTLKMAGIIAALLLFGVYSQTLEFIYFQF